MSDMTENAKITIDGVDYAIDKLSDNAKSQIANIQFSDKQILQLQNEWAISNTARVGYLRAFQKEWPQIDKPGN
jgi:hypothetical protein